MNILYILSLRKYNLIQDTVKNIIILILKHFYTLFTVKFCNFTVCMTAFNNLNSLLFYRLFHFDIMCDIILCYIIVKLSLRI